MFSPLFSPHSSMNLPKKPISFPPHLHCQASHLTGVDWSTKSIIRPREGDLFLNTSSPWQTSCVLLTLGNGNGHVEVPFHGLHLMAHSWRQLVAYLITGRGGNILKLNLLQPKHKICVGTVWHSIVSIDLQFFFRPLGTCFH